MNSLEDIIEMLEEMSENPTYRAEFWKDEISAAHHYLEQRYHDEELEEALAALDSE